MGAGHAADEQDASSSPPTANGVASGMPSVLASPSVADITTVAAFALAIVLGVTSGYWAALPLGFGCWLGARAVLQPGQLGVGSRIAIVVSLVASGIVFAVVDRDEPAEQSAPLTLEDLQEALASPGQSANDPTAFPTGYYGPSRPILDWATQSDRYGFTDGPHFNSYINTPNYGDERAFLDVKPWSHQEPGGFQDQLSEVSGRYLVRAYLVNGAIEDPSLAEAMTARNTRIRFEIPNGKANGFTIQARLTADNAIPSEIYDVATLRNDSQSFSLALVHNSGRIYTNAHPEGLPLSDKIVNDGVVIGSDELNGDVPPGYQNSMIVTIELAATP